MKGLPPPEAFAFGLVVALLAFHFVYLQLRRLRYRRIADELQAAYESQGVFKSGEIRGSAHGRSYTIASKVVTVGRDSRTYTTVSVNCLYQGIPLSIQGKFFKHFPDWRYAFTRGDAQQNAVGVELVLQNAPVHLDSKYYPQVQNLFHDFGLVFPKLLEKRRIRIDLNPEAVSYRWPGVLKNAAEVSEILLLLTKLTERAQANPVVD